MYLYYIFLSSQNNYLISLSSLSFSLETKEFTKSFIPRIKKVKDAINFNIISGTKFEIEPPANAPIKLANTRAVEEPKNIANGLLEVPLIVNVANCVLSPSSAINIVRNVDKSILKIIYI